MRLLRQPNIFRTKVSTHRPNYQYLSPKPSGYFFACLFLLLKSCVDAQKHCSQSSGFCRPVSFICACPQSAKAIGLLRSQMSVRRKTAQDWAHAGMLASRSGQQAYARKGLCLRGPADETQSCNNQSCPVDCELADWSGWSDCEPYCLGLSHMLDWK